MSGYDEDSEEFKAMVQAEMDRLMNEYKKEGNDAPVLDRQANSPPRSFQQQRKVSSPPSEYNIGVGNASQKDKREKQRAYAAQLNAESNSRAVEPSRKPFKARGDGSDNVYGSNMMGMIGQNDPSNQSADARRAKQREYAMMLGGNNQPQSGDAPQRGGRNNGGSSSRESHDYPHIGMDSASADQRKQNQRMEYAAQLREQQEMKSKSEDSGRRSHGQRSNSNADSYQEQAPRSQFPGQQEAPNSGGKAHRQPSQQSPGIFGGNGVSEDMERYKRLEKQKQYADQIAQASYAAPVTAPVVGHSSKYNQHKARLEEERAPVSTAASGGQSSKYLQHKARVEADRTGGPSSPTGQSAKYLQHKARMEADQQLSARETGSIFSSMSLGMLHESIMLFMYNLHGGLFVSPFLIGDSETAAERVKKQYAQKEYMMQLQEAARQVRASVVGHWKQWWCILYVHYCV